MIGDFTNFRKSVNIDVIQNGFEFEIFDHRKKSLVSDICDLRVNELQMLDESMSRPRRPFFTPQTFRSVVGIEDKLIALYPHDAFGVKIGRLGRDVPTSSI